MGHEALIEDILPRELCIEQMPARLRHDAAEFRCSYFAIMKGDRFDGLLIVINDVTAELLHARQEAERKEILAMFEALTKDRTGFLAFIDEANDRSSRCAARPAHAKVHSPHIEGQCRANEFAIISNLCHQAETHWPPG